MNCFWINNSFLFLWNKFWYFYFSLNFNAEGRIVDLTLTSFPLSTDFVKHKCQVFMMRSGSPYLVHALIMVIACQPDMCHLTLISFLWHTDFVIVKYVLQCLSLFLDCNKTGLTIFGQQFDHDGFLSATWPLPYFHGLLTLLNVHLHHVFVL